MHTCCGKIGSWKYRVEERGVVEHQNEGKRSRVKSKRMKGELCKTSAGKMGVTVVASDSAPDASPDTRPIDTFMV